MTSSLIDIFIFSGIVRGHVKFLSVVESLEEVLTHEHINIRERGIGYLSWVVSQFPVDFLNSAEISTMINFYCDCLKGNHNWLPATIRGLLAVVRIDILYCILYKELFVITLYPNFV